MQKVTKCFKVWPVDIAAMQAVMKVAKMSESEVLRFLMRSGLASLGKTPASELRRAALKMEAKTMARQMMLDEDGGEYALDDDDE